MAQDQEPALPVFTIEKIYVKDLSLEVPNAPQIFLERDTPRSTSSSARVAPLDDGHYEAVLTSPPPPRSATRRCFWWRSAGRNFPDSQPAARERRTGARRHLPQHPLPLCTGSGVGCGCARGLPAVPAGPGQLRGALPTAHAAGPAGTDDNALDAMPGAVAIRLRALRSSACLPRCWSPCSRWRSISSGRRIGGRVLRRAFGQGAQTVCPQPGLSGRDTGHARRLAQGARCLR